MHRHKWFAPVFVVALVAVITALLSAFRPQAEKREPEPESLLQIHALQVQKQDYVVQIPSQGLLKARIQSTLAAQVAGNVVAVSEQFRRGGHFQQGDWLLTIDPRDYEVAVTLAQANVRKAQLAMQQEQAQADQALRDWQRLAKQPKNQAPDLVLRKPQLAAAEAELASTQAQLRKAQLDLERTKIVAPFNGRVAAQTVDLGHYVNPGVQLAQLIGADVLEVDLPISARWRGLLDFSAGPMPVQLLSSAYPDHKPWQAQVVRSSSEIDANSRQWSLIAELPVDSARWNAGLQVGDFVSATISGRTLTDVYVIPRAALVDGKFLWRVEQGRLYKRPVTVRWQDAEVAVVATGLNDGDWVNLTPLAYMISGTAVEMVEPLAKLQDEPTNDTPEALAKRSTEQ